MITKSVSVPVLDRVATSAEVHEARDGIVIYDLLDEGELLAKARYSVEAESPFVLTPEEVAFITACADALAADGGAV